MEEVLVISVIVFYSIFFATLLSRIVYGIIYSEEDYNFKDEQSK